MVQTLKPSVPHYSLFALTIHVSPFTIHGFWRRGMVRHERLILLLVAVAASIPTGIITRQSMQSDALTGFSVMTSPRRFVYVGGDVAHPGMYPLSVNMMTTSVIKMAIPLKPLKSLIPSAVTAQLLKNGDDVRLRIGEHGQGVVTIDPIPAPEKIIMGIPLDINTMRVADFQLLPGVGPKTATRIIEYRQNNGGRMTPEELLNVEGIGEKKYKILKSRF
jgi:competence protein ComEA